MQGSYAARTMRWGGVIILLFVVYHMLDLTTGTVNPVGDAGQPVRATSSPDFAPARWYVTLFYVVAIVVVGLHLRHGIFSALHTLGQQTAAPASAGPASSRWSSASSSSPASWSVPFAVTDRIGELT